MSHDVSCGLFRLALLALVAVASAVLAVDATCSRRLSRVSLLLLLLLLPAVAIAVVAVHVEMLLMLPPLRLLQMRVQIIYHLRQQEECMLSCVMTADCMVPCCRDKQTSPAVL